MGGGGKGVEEGGALKIKKILGGLGVGGGGEGVLASVKCN